jgi:DNA-binding response OmpR family regulator
MDNILIVDDEDQMRKYMLEVLRGEGYALSEASGGKKAIRQIQRKAFNLVISDVVMPGMDGLELIQEIRKRHPTLKILAISGAGWNTPDIYLGLAMGYGADAILLKPFGSNRLIDKVASLLKN